MVMELQLGLALPSNPMRGFDLNAHGTYESKEILGSDLFGCNEHCLERKRSFGEAFGPKNLVVPPDQTLPLLFWDNQNIENNDPKDLDSCSSITNKDVEGENATIGWPPIKSWRKKLCYQNLDGRFVVENGGGCCGGGGGYRGSNSMFVKVKMEGVGIARKVDLSLHHSYETLLDTLLAMFGKCLEDGNGYRLAYQDNDGDWLLTGDIPWRTFIGSVQRLKLLKNSS